MADRLKNKVAMVFGAGSSGPGWSNGKAAAVAYAREGAKVFCVDLHLGAAQETADLIKAEGFAAEPVAADVTSSASVELSVGAALADA
ncbi:MAG: SDR family NAD(P)-dependent oxidoreductase, partial [Alphaproteobacteria bacterium]